MKKRELEPTTPPRQEQLWLFPGFDGNGGSDADGDHPGEKEPPSGDEFLTAEEVAEWLRMTRDWVYDHADELGGFRVGKYLRFLRSRIIERPERGL